MSIFKRYSLIDLALFFVILNFLSFLEPSASQTFSETKYEDVNETKLLTPFERKWVTELFYEAKNKFRMDSASIKCREDFDIYLKHLRNQSIWAVRMTESGEWPSVGVFSGRTFHMGNYDECLKVSTNRFKGQYCLSQINYDYKNFLSPGNSELKHYPNEESSAWDALYMYKHNRVRLDRSELHFALCIPSSCKVSDLKSSLNDTLYPVFHEHGLNVVVTVDPAFCTTSSGKPFSQEYYVTLCILVCLVSLVIICTYQDIITSSDEKNQDKLTIYTSFSFVKNVKKLTNLDTTNEIVVIHTVKFISMVVLIHAHRLVYFLGYPLENAELAEETHYMPPFEFLHPNFVDVFFAITGYMTFYSGLASMKKRGGILVVINILLRWIRMMPAFCILMLYTVYVLRYTGNGPLWNHKTGEEISKCENSWWASILGINNLVQVDQQCLIISWYISIDLQLAILGEILLYLFTKNKRMGTILSILAFIGSTCITFIIIYQNNYHGIVRYYLKMLEDVRKDEEYVNVYTATYPRIAPYIIGFLTAYIVKTLVEKKFKFSKGQIIAIFSIATLIGEGSTIYGHVFYDSLRSYNAFENAIYGALYHSIFPLAAGFMACVYFTTGLGIFNKFLEWKYFIFFGRLTYSVFLVNSVIQLYHSSSQKQVMPDASRMNIVWWSISDVLWCYLIGFIFHVMVEAPISNLCKILRTKIIRILENRKPKVVPIDDNAL